MNLDRSTAEEHLPPVHEIRNHWNAHEGVGEGVTPEIYPKVGVESFSLSKGNTHCASTSVASSPEQSHFESLAD